MEDVNLDLPPKDLPHSNDVAFRQARAFIAASERLDQHLTEAIAELTPTPLPTVNLTEAKPPMATTPSPGGFAAQIRSMMDAARAGVEQARTNGLAKVGDAVGKLKEAEAATVKVTDSMVQTMEDEAASLLSELGQISNDL
jgi:hypothetical protein